MAIRANIVLTDATPVTPVAHTFYPVTSDAAGLLKWVDRTQGIAVGQNRLSLSQRIPGQGAQTYKCVWKLEQPILAATSPSTSTGIQPVPVADHVNVFSMDIVMHERADSQERIDLLTMARDLIDEAIVTNQVQNLDLVW